FQPVLDAWAFLLSGVWVTLLLSVAAAGCSFVAGTAIALARIYGPRWLHPVLVFYIDSMRALPVLVVLVWMYFAFPLVAGINLPPFVSALVALTLHLAAYVAEVLRAGIEGIRPGQTRAGFALGMSQWQVIRQIILPQALVRMLPSLGSILSVTIKDTAISAVIAVPDLMRRAESVAANTYHPVEVFTTAMVVYFIMIFPVTRDVDMLYRRVAHLGRS
ncbi:amino acid ABC transporter permease, partial [Acidisphaera sp. L21]|uniref:amino acid ABC transporter permease n=1 Tax=Acidisphaera sp. L21 TaxID=1641851 RepID=UPI00131BAAE0